MCGSLERPEMLSHLESSRVPRASAQWRREKGLRLPAFAQPDLVEERSSFAGESASQ